MAMRRVAAEPEADRLQSVKRALAVLETLAGRPHGVTPKELSRILGLHLSTSYRLVNTLVAAGYVARGADSGLFRLAQRVAYLHNGYLAALSPPAGALPFVHALQLATGESAMLTQLEGDDLVCTATVPGNRLGAHPPAYVGMAVAAHAVAAGRTLLAWLSSPQIEAYLARQAATPNSPFPVTNPAVLRAELERIRLAGYALDRGEGHPEICCIAAPVFDPTGAVVSSVSLMVSCARLGREERTLVATTLAVARAIGGLHLDSPARDERIDVEQQEPDAATKAEIEAALASVAEVMSRVG
jgi:DNA-binding IclR family transcriptional regulator